MSDGGAICDVGYSTDHYFKSRGKCEVCGKIGQLVWECGWIGSRILHASKTCRGYFEVDDGGLAWKRQVNDKTYGYILEEAYKALERDGKLKDATGRKCRTCGTTRGVGYYGMPPDPFKCFCKKHHREWLNSREYRVEHGLEETAPTPNKGTNHELNK